jgi:hypothetical protein
MVSSQIDGNGQSAWPASSGLWSPKGTGAGVVSVELPTFHPPSCAPFAPGPLRPFLATMGALTPAHLTLGRCHATPAPLVDGSP